MSISSFEKRRSVAFHFRSQLFCLYGGSAKVLSDSTLGENYNLDRHCEKPGRQLWQLSKRRYLSNYALQQLAPQISEIFRFMSGKKMSALRLDADSALKSCRRHNGEQPAVERSDTAG
jgi:hypothetical protein